MTSNAKIYIGTAGFIDSKDIDCAEIEFTHGVRMNDVVAHKIISASKKNNTLLSVHAPYFINLNSLEPQKVKDSMKRIIDSAIAAKRLGARCVVFHPGYYGEMAHDDVYNNIRDRISEILQVLKDNEIDIAILPETAGKRSQFGSVDELMKLRDDLGIDFCTDFAHVVAHSNGKANHKETVGQIQSLRKIHCHFSGIEYTDKGERRHLMTCRTETKKLLSALYDSDIKEATIINESPDPYNDALMMIQARDEISKNGH